MGKIVSCTASSKEYFPLLFSFCNFDNNSNNAFLCVTYKASCALPTSESCSVYSLNLLLKNSLSSTFSKFLFNNVVEFF